MRPCASHSSSVFDGIWSLRRCCRRRRTEGRWRWAAWAWLGEWMAANLQQARVQILQGAWLGTAQCWHVDCRESGRLGSCGMCMRTSNQGRWEGDSRMHLAAAGCRAVQDLHHLDGCRRVRLPAAPPVQNGKCWGRQSPGQADPTASTRCRSVSKSNFSSMGVMWTTQYIPYETLRIQRMGEGGGGRTLAALVRPSGAPGSRLRERYKLGAAAEG